MPKHLDTHAYSDSKAFDRLMLLIATLVQHPGIGSSHAPEDSQNKDTSLREVLTHIQTIAATLNLTLPDYSVHTLRKDLRTLRRYGLLDHRRYQWGYYLGTGVMGRSELQMAMNALQSQALYQQDPQVSQVYEMLVNRLRGIDLEGNLLYPVRTQLNRTIIYTNPEEMMSDHKYRGTLFEKLPQLETAILQGQAIEIYRSRNPYQSLARQAHIVYPLQLIYSDIAWYLLYEEFQSEHLATSRLDRFSDHWQVIEAEGRGSAQQLKSLQLAHRLLESGWGLYLGSLEEQAQEKTATLKFIDVTVRFFPEVMDFILEGEKRHPSQQITEGPKNTNRRTSYIDYTVKLPPRSIDDFSRWVNRFLGNAQVLSPPDLVEKYCKASQRMVAQYAQYTSI